MKIILLGIMIAIVGFAYAFSGSVTAYLTSYHYSWYQKILGGYPNLVSGFVIGLGGIAITIIGAINRRRK